MADDNAPIAIAPLQIYNTEGRLIFQINDDGTAEGEVADASEAARIFADTFIARRDARENGL